MMAGTIVARSEGAGEKSDAYRVTIHVDRVDSLHLEALVELVNPTAIAALTLPLQWGNGRSAYRLDSADYQGLRTDYFALKTFRIDSTKQTVLIGLISDLGGNYPPLEPGDGGIARLHFSSKRPITTALAIDTTFIPPHNVLQLVTPDVRAIRPTFQSSMKPKP
jgi:hypothetical protein